MLKCIYLSPFYNSYSNYNSNLLKQWTLMCKVSFFLVELMWPVLTTVTVAIITGSIVVAHWRFVCPTATIHTSSAIAILTLSTCCKIHRNAMGCNKCNNPTTRDMQEDEQDTELHNSQWITRTNEIPLLRNNGRIWANKNSATWW